MQILNVSIDFKVPGMNGKPHLPEYCHGVKKPPVAIHGKDETVYNACSYVKCYNCITVRI